MSNRYLSIDDRREELAELVDEHPDLGEEFRRRYRMSWIYHENALEGVVLAEPEIAAALEAQLVADASLVSVVTLVRNHKACLDLVEAEAKEGKAKVNLALAKQLFETLQRGVPDNGKGMMRKEMPLHRAYYHDIAQPPKIEDQLKKLVDFTGSAEFKEFHPVKQAAYVHWQFMQVYPYSEHNGRVARLLQNVYLVRGGYPPAIIHAIDRQKYYDALRLPLATLRAVLLEGVDNSLENAIKFIRARRAEQRKAASGK